MTHPLTTNELARAVGMVPDSIRVRLCRTGSFYGLRPQRLPNGRLLWPADSLERLLAQGQKASTPGPRNAQKKDAAVAAPEATRKPNGVEQVEAMRKLMEPLPLRVRLEDWRLEHGINNRALSALMRILNEEQEAA